MCQKKTIEEEEEKRMLFIQLQRGYHGSFCSKTKRLRNSCQANSDAQKNQNRTDIIKTKSGKGSNQQPYIPIQMS